MPQISTTNDLLEQIRDGLTDAGGGDNTDVVAKLQELVDCCVSDPVAPAELIAKLEAVRLLLVNADGTLTAFSAANNTGLLTIVTKLEASNSYLTAINGTNHTEVKAKFDAVITALGTVATNAANTKAAVDTANTHLTTIKTDGAATKASAASIDTNTANTKAAVDTANTHLTTIKTDGAATKASAAAIDTNTANSYAEIADLKTLSQGYWTANNNNLIAVGNIMGTGNNLQGDTNTKLDAVNTALGTANTKLTEIKTAVEASGGGTYNVINFIYCTGTSVIAANTAHRVQISATSNGQSVQIKFGAGGYMDYVLNIGQTLDFMASTVFSGAIEVIKIAGTAIMIAVTKA